MHNLRSSSSISLKSLANIRVIKAILVIAILTSGLFSPALQMPVYAVDVPGLVSPADGARITATGDSGSLTEPPVAIPEFSWTPVAEATAYRLQLSQDIGFVSKIEFTTPLTHFTPLNAGQFNDGTWYWRVRVDSPTAGNFSTIRSFIRQWASPDNFPVLNSPEDVATLDFYGASTFKWQPVIGAAQYRFQISTTPDGFNSPIYNQTTLVTTYQPTIKLANGTYYWRVVPIDPVNHEGTASVVRQFTLAYGSSTFFPAEVPTLIEPLDKFDPNYTPPTFTPTFRWKAVRGASSYRLEYTSDPTCNFGSSGYTTSLETRNTTYTPTNAFPNDVNYCWHVRAQSGNSIGDWSETWEFIKQWYIQAVPLTPVNNYQHTKYLFFSWTPVPGAAYYKLEVSKVNSFPPPNGFTVNTVNPFYSKSDFYCGSGILYWRVTPYDRNNNASKPSDGFPYPHPASFICEGSSLVPNQYYPLYYYLPNDFPPPDNGVTMQPNEDRTVPLPIFMWNRVFDQDGNEAAAYRVQVDDDPLFLSVDWDFKTENLSAVPTAGNPFTPQANQDYYWRVCTLESLAGDCISPWSQIWQTRIDLSKTLAPTSQITLLRPLDASEHVEMTPLFEWWPLQNADSYQVQISQDPNFGSTVIDEPVPYPAYMPQTSLAQRTLGHLAYGTYYWRVRGLPSGTWSAPWRFQLAAQSQWQDTRGLGNPVNQQLVASDPDDIDDDNFELTNLFTVQDKDFWYFGFNVYTSTTNMTYGLYLDLDNIDGSGATSDARNFNLTTIAAHHPEYAIYLFQDNSGFDASKVAIYRWTGTGWANNPQTLDAVGGGLQTGSNYVEIRVPNTTIGMAEDTSSVSLSLFSVDQNSNTVQDTVPSSTSTSLLDRFTSVSERLNLALPPNNTSGDPYTFSSVPPFAFNFPSLTQWEGYNLQIALDSRFTTPVRDYQLTANTPFLAAPIYTEHTKVQDIQGDNTYYWRVRPQYAPTNIFGAWSQVGRFERQGFVPQNLHVSVNFATPTFSWDKVDGASSYDLQVDNDPNFGSIDISASTASNSYTPQNTLANGRYYWRVRLQRDGGISPNDWSPPQSFVLTLPVPGNLSPNDPQQQNVVGRAPTYCWDPLIVSSNNIDILAAYKYRLQVSKGDPTFSTIYESVDTEQVCWTPTRGYDDGQYYWRVAMIDGEGHLGEYSPAAEFTKQYPHAVPASPTSGSQMSDTPTFVWTQEDGVTRYVHGAASYKLEISWYETFSPAFDSVTTHNTRYTPTKLYPTDHTYYWRVAIIDKDGKVGPFSDATIILNPYAGKENIFLPVLIK